MTPMTPEPANEQPDQPAKTAREVALLAAQAADERKAVDIVIQEVRETVGICDYFVIATGSIDRHVDAICDAVEEKLRLQAGVKPYSREGVKDLTWVLLDYGDVVMHVFQPEARDFYRLETLWNDSPLVDLSEAGITDPEYSERIRRLMTAYVG